MNTAKGAEGVQGLRIWSFRGRQRAGPRGKGRFRGEGRGKGGTVGGEGKSTGGGEGLGAGGDQRADQGGGWPGRGLHCSGRPRGSSPRREEPQAGRRIVGGKARPPWPGRAGGGRGHAAPSPGAGGPSPSFSQAPPLPLLPPFPPPRAGPRPPPPPPARPPSRRGPPGRPSRAPPHSPPTPKRGVDSSLPLMVAAEGRAQGGPVRGGWGGPGKTRTLTRQANPDRTGRGGVRRREQRATSPASAPPLHCCPAQ